MIIEKLYKKIGRKIFPLAIWDNYVSKEKSVYLTFDDGPVESVTPWVLDLLYKYQIPGSFFCIGDNVEKYPNIFDRILNEGHAVGNHTFNHLSGWTTASKTYYLNVDSAGKIIKSNLFRPPYGKLTLAQYNYLKEKYKIVMWDVLTEDYDASKNAEFCLNKIKSNTKNGSIIVFHDSIKAEKNLKGCLEQSIVWLINEGYSFKKIQ